MSDENLKKALDEISKKERASANKFIFGFGIVGAAFLVFAFLGDGSDNDERSSSATLTSTAPSADALVRQAERERMEPYENLRIIDGRAYRADAYESVVGRLAANNCKESHQKIVDMAAFSKGKLRGSTAYQILMNMERELRGMPKRECAELFAAYILLNGGG